METETTKSILPRQLQNEAFGFVKLRKGTKIPFEQGWQDKPYSYKEISEWFELGGNYGVLGGMGKLIIFDPDRPELNDIAVNRFPKTFTVKTGKSFHYYYFCENIKKKIVLKKDTPTQENQHFGEIISTGSQAVGPGSIHPDTGKAYAVVEDIPIATIDRELLFSELSEYIELEQPQTNSEAEINNVSIVDVLNKKGVVMRHNGSNLVGGHPIHGSTNNNNFVVSPEKNVFHCFRCDSGGGPLLLIAVLEGIITCQEAVPGSLRGRKFNETLRAAKEIYGFDIRSSGHDQDDVLLTDEEIAVLEAKIKAIPADTARVSIPALLDPILKTIAKYNVAQGDAFLKHVIKGHFGFTDKELQSYEKVLKSHRKDPKEFEGKKSLSRDDLIKALHDEQASKTIHPAQDYCEGVMSFAVKIRDSVYILTSDGRLFSAEDASFEGFNLKHSTVDTSRFSGSGVCRYLEGNYKIKIHELYQKICDYIGRFVHFTDESYLHYIALWVMGTYIFMIFRYYPYVWLNAEKASGKTLLMEVLSTIAFNGELITNPTESVIFRDISNNLITMCIDEVEQLRKRDQDTYGTLISILNSGFNKAGMVKRVESTGQGGYVVKAYSAYSPKMFAGIAELDDVLADRTVRIPLLRKKDGEIVERYKSTNEIIELQRNIRDDLYVFALTYAKRLSLLYYEEKLENEEGLSHLRNREIDIWEPIVVLANLVDVLSGNNNLVQEMKVLSKKSSEEKQSDSVSQNETYKILSVLKVMLDEVEPWVSNGDIRIFEADHVFEFFKKSEEFQWIEKTNILTRRLRKVNVRSEQRRFGGGEGRKRVYIINLSEFTDLCDRFKI